MENLDKTMLNAMAMKLIGKAYDGAYFVDPYFVEDVACALGDIQMYASNTDEYPVGWSCLWNILKQIESRKEPIVFHNTVD